jgi:alkylation response protein AidB-like acyl-CoA dehydrogenase
VDFELTEEQAALQEISRGMLATHCPPRLVRSLANAGSDVDDKLWQRAAELGWIDLAVPAESGGSGQGITELCLVAEEIGRVVAPGAFIDTALVAIALTGSSREGLVPDLAAGRAKASWAHHGRVSGSYDDDAFVVSGRATAVLAAAAADWLLITADSDEGRRLVLVEQPRARVEARRTLDETRRWYDVVLDGVRIPAADIISVDQGQIEWLSDAAAVLTAADALGVGERLLEMTNAYVKVREQFGRPIGSFQAVKHKLADMLTTLKVARAAIYYAAMALDAGAADTALASSAAKAFTGQGVAALASEALQTHGGIGFTWEHDLHLYLRRAKVDEMLHGTTAEHHERIVARIAGTARR